MVVVIVVTIVIAVVVTVVDTLTRAFLSIPSFLWVPLSDKMDTNAGVVVIGVGYGSIISASLASIQKQTEFANSHMSVTLVEHSKTLLDCLSLASVSDSLHLLHTSSELSNEFAIPPHTFNFASGASHNRKKPFSATSRSNFN